jgi:hypothetical protein
MTLQQSPQSALKRTLRLALKAVLSLAAVAILGFLAVVLINAVDEDLSADARTLLAPPQMGKIENSNGFVAFLGIVAPKDQDQMEWGRKAAAAYAAQAQPGFVQSAEWKEATRAHIGRTARGGVPKPWCTPEARDCLADATRDGAAVAKVLEAGDNALFLARYRKAREGASFADVYIGANVAANLPPYWSLIHGASLAHADAALKLAAGNVEAAVAELEREVAFHRKIIAGGRTVVAVMIGNRLLSRDLLTISELARSDGGRIAPYRARLSALARPQASAAALEPAFRFEAHTWANFAHGIRTILRDNRGWMLRDGAIVDLSPAYNWALSLLALPNQSANLVAAMAMIDASITGVPPQQFDAKVKEVAAAKARQLTRPWYSKLRNPVGKENFEDGPNLASYAARMYDLQALERMTSLQIALAERGISDAAAVAAFVAGEGAQSYADPYTGKPFAFDPTKRLLSFEPRAKGGVDRDLKTRYGRTGIAI